MVRAELIPFQLPGPAARAAVCLALTDDGGRTGLGEAAPMTSTYPHWGRGLAGAPTEPETAAASAAALTAVTDALDALDDRAPPLAAVTAALAPHAQALLGAPAARFALETALLDLLAQRRGIDVCEALRDPATRPAPPAAPHAPDDLARTLPIGALVTVPASDPTFLAAANAALARGFRVLKVKLTSLDDASLDREIAGLLALRRAAPDVELRLDPNARWNADTAPRFLDRLSVVRPSYVEQPVAFEHLDALHRAAVPWAADEEVGEPRSQRFLRRERGCVAYVLKPAALGIARALELVHTARSLAEPVAVVVTHFMDGPVGLAAACELALSLDPPPLPCGLDLHPGLTAGPFARPELHPHHRAPATIQRTGKPGLGLDRALLLDALRASPLPEVGESPPRASHGPPRGA